MWKKMINSIKKWFAGVKHFIKKQDRKTIITSIVVIIIVIAGAIYYFKSHPGVDLKFWQFGDKKVAAKTIEFINSNNLASSEASLVSVSRESGLIKIKIKIGTTEFDSYVSKDGKYLFPNIIDMSEADESETENTETTSAASCDALTKTDSPMLDAYVVSACPYGLQMQRAMADAVARVPELANYIKVRYIGSVSGDTISSMHGEEEATENLRQICIREEQSDKYWGYVSCFIKAGDSTGCLQSSGVNSSTLSSCMSDSSKGITYAKQDFDLADSLGVSGSPTLALGGAIVEEFTPDNKPIWGSSRSSDEIKSIICCASNSEPSFCSQTLDTASAASSYSENYAGTGSTSTANCE